MEERKEIKVAELRASLEHRKDFTPIGIRRNVSDPGPFYHGTKADLKIGDLVETGFPSNYGRHGKANFVYTTAIMDGAVLAAELAEGDGKCRVYTVEPTGAIDDDPNLTDQKFPGNITRSYRTREPLRIVDEVSDWQPHSPELLRDIKNGVGELTRLGIEAIND
jgi:rifampin ADP-ribosylating transferase